MAGKKISELTALGGSFAGTDLFEISKDDGGGSYSTKSITGAEIITSIGAGSGTVTSVAIAGGTTGLTVTGSPITTTGTITIGGALVAASGGTGQTSYSTGDILYASGATAISKLSVGSNTEVLTLAGGVPTWAAPAGGSAWTTSGSDIYYNTGMVGIGLTSGFGATLHVKGQGATYTTTSLLIEDSAGAQIMKLTDAGDNICIGKTAGDSITGGGGLNNVCIGLNAGTAITTGDGSVCIGKNSKAGSTLGANVVIGRDAGNAAMKYYNIAIGEAAGYNINASGTGNAFMGYNAGLANTSGSYNVALGYSANVLAAGNNQIAIGKSAVTTATDQINIGGNIIGSMTAADRYTTFIGQAYSPTSTLTSAATITPDFTNGNTYKVTLAHNTALANPTNPKDGATYTIIVTQDVTGSRTMSFGANYKWAGGSAPTLSTAAGAVDILTFISDGTNMYGTSTLNFS